MKSNLPTPTTATFTEVVQLIQTAKQQAFKAVNTTLLNLYWQIGSIISKKLESAEWGHGVVEQLAQHVAHHQPGLRGFTRSNLFRMSQFYNTYRDDETLQAMALQLPWTHNLIIMGQAKRQEEREFYLRLATREQWGKRELERQFKSALFERTVLNPLKVAPLVRQMHPQADSVFKDAYMLEFLGLPDDHSEADLHRGLLHKLKNFLAELGRDFCFVGSEFPVQGVGGISRWICCSSIAV
jgi:predicted nuclease of restriction endonuclease-like (RecB) superfamily